MGRLAGCEAGTVVAGREQDGTTVIGITGGGTPTATRRIPHRNRRVIAGWTTGGATTVGPSSRKNHTVGMITRRAPKRNRRAMAGGTTGGTTTVGPNSRKNYTSLRRSLKNECHRLPPCHTIKIVKRRMPLTMFWRRLFCRLLWRRLFLRSKGNSQLQDQDTGPVRHKVHDFGVIFF